MRIGPTTIMLIHLLKECNLSCPHCSNESLPFAPGYKLSFEQLQTCLSDCHRLGVISRVHFSGGEPTLWKDENRILTDLLIYIADQDFSPGITTNGLYFSDSEKCNEFCRHYFDNSVAPLHLTFSIDTFHRNFDANNSRSEILENVLEFKKRMPIAKRSLLELSVIAIISKDPDSLLPVGMVEKYQNRGIPFTFLPLIKMGRAEELDSLCPDLNSDRREDHGAYHSFWLEQKIKQPDEYLSHITLIANDYYYYAGPANPGMTKVATLGCLPAEIIVNGVL